MRIASAIGVGRGRIDLGRIAATPRYDVRHAEGGKPFTAAGACGLSRS